MTLPAWPSDLPKPTRTSWSGQRQDGRQRRSVDTGPPGYRRRFSSVARIHGMQLDVTRSQKAVFDTFYEETTAFGALPFTMPDPTTDGWALLDADGAPILDGAGTPILLAATWVCLFGVEPPTEGIPAGVRFTINFTVAVMP